MKKFLLHILFLAFVFTGTAQGPGRSKNKFIRTLQKTVWTAGISGIVIDDDGNTLKKLFNVNENWNMLPFPTKAHLEGFIDKGLSVEGAFAYMRLKKGKILGKDYVRTHNVNLFSFDVNAKYDLNEIIGDTRAFSPYAIGGLGYSRRSVGAKKNAITANIGLGFNIWIYKGWGLNAQSIAKFALNKATGRNYLEHSIGVVYRFNLLTGYRTPNRLGHRYNLFRNQ